jgi:hypothetical protein
MAKTKVKELLDQMEKPFKGMKGKQTKQYAQFMGIVASMVATMAESTKKTPGMKKILDQLSGMKKAKSKEEGADIKGGAKKAATPEQLANLTKGRAVQRVGQLREKYGENLKEFITAQGEQVKETGSAIQLLKDLNVHVLGVKATIQNSLLGPLSPIANNVTDFFKNSTKKLFKLAFKKWAIEWFEVRRQRKLDKKNETIFKKQVNILNAIKEKYKESDKSTSEWAENQINLLTEQKNRQDEENKRKRIFDKTSLSWEKKQGKEQIKWEKKTAKEVTEIKNISRAQQLFSFLQGLLGNAMGFLSTAVKAAFEGLSKLADIIKTAIMAAIPTLFGASFISAMTAAFAGAIPLLLGAGGVVGFVKEMKDILNFDKDAKSKERVLEKGHAAKVSSFGRFLNPMTGGDDPLANIEQTLFEREEKRKAALVKERGDKEEEVKKLVFDKDDKDFNSLIKNTAETNKLLEGMNALLEKQGYGKKQMSSIVSAPTSVNNMSSSGGSTGVDTLSKMAREWNK